MYWYKREILRIDQVFKDFKPENRDNYSYIYLPWGV